MRKHVSQDGSTFEYNSHVVSVHLGHLQAAYPGAVAVSVLLDAANKIRVLVHSEQDLEAYSNPNGTGFCSMSVDDVGRLRQTLFQSGDYELDVPPQKVRGA